MNSQVLYGPGFNVLLPDGYFWYPHMRPVNIFGAMQQTGISLHPPGASVRPIYPGLVFIEAVPPQLAQQLGNMLYNFDNPMVSWFNAMSLGVQGIHNVGTVRQNNLPSGRAHIREFEATGQPPTNQPMRFMMMLLEGPLVTAQVIIGINLFRWADFMGPFLNIVAGANLAGGQPVQSQVFAKIDPDNSDQVELNVRGSNQEVMPVTTMPASVNGATIINIATLQVTDIAGVKLFEGAHTLNVKEVAVGDSYQVNQAGAVGPNAHAENTTFNQGLKQAQDQIDLIALANELSQLRAAVRSEPAAPDADAKDEAAGTLLAAEKAAKTGDRHAAFEHLAGVGKWVLDLATKIGAEVAVKALESAIGL